MGDEDDDSGRLEDWLEDISLASPKSNDTVVQENSDDAEEESDGENYLEKGNEMEDSPIDYVYSKCKHVTKQDIVMVQIPLTKLTAAKELIDLTSSKSPTEECKKLMRHLKEREKDGLHLTLVKDRDTEASKYQMNTRSKDKVTQKIVNTQQTKKKPGQETVVKKVLETGKNLRTLASERQKHKINESIADLPKKIARLNNVSVRSRSRQLSVSDALLSYEGLGNRDTPMVDDTPEKTFGQYLPPPEYQSSIASPAERRDRVNLDDQRFNCNDDNASWNAFRATPVPVARKQVNKESGNSGTYDIHDERWKAAFPARRSSTASVISNAPSNQNIASTPVQIQDRRRFSTPERSNRIPESDDVSNSGKYGRNLVNSFNTNNGAELPVQINANNRRSSVSSTTPYPTAMTPMKIRNHSTFLMENPHLNKIRMRCNNHNALWKTGPYGQQSGNHHYNNTPQVQTPDVRVYTNMPPDTNNFTSTRSRTERLRNFRKKPTAPNPNESATNSGGNNNLWN